MDIDIDPLSPTPIYQQIRDAIVRGIGRGELHRGDTLASVRSLAGAFGINPATVAKAYDLLRSEGLLESNAKSGSFISRDRTSGEPGQAFIATWTEKLTTLLAEGVAKGLGADAALQSCHDVLKAMDEHLGQRAEADGAPTTEPITCEQEKRP